MGDPMTYVPQPSNWFTDQITYQGEGRLEGIGHKEIWASGPAWIHCTGMDDSMLLHATGFGLPETGKDHPLEWALNGGLVCDAFSVKCTGGTVSCTGPVYPGANFKVMEGSGVSVSFTAKAMRYEYHRACHAAPRYWVMPLANYITDCIQKNHDLDNHPLRIYPTPKLAREDRDDPRCRLNAVSHNALIVFQEHGRTCFIEKVPEYKERADELKSGSRRSATTAIMVGEVDGRPTCSFETLESWFPFDLLRMLTLATGSPVGAPWIEIRDAQGRLCARFHAALHKAPYRRGHSAVRELLTRGTGSLLTSAPNSKHWQTTELRILLSLLDKALASELYNVDDRLAYVCRACEVAFDLYGIGPTYLADQLSPSTRSAIREILHDTSERILGLVASTQSIDETTSLERIARRATKTPIEKDRAFGVQVLDLLQMVGLRDAECTCPYFGRKSGPSWSSMMSMYRGAVIHDGGLRTLDHTHDVMVALFLIHHLGDILLRVLLPLLGYDGEYVPVVSGYPRTSRLDWVTDRTDPGKEWYGNPD